jgi:hypothetical protein
MFKFVPCPGVKFWVGRNSLFLTFTHYRSVDLHSHRVYVMASSTLGCVLFWDYRSVTNTDSTGNTRGGGAYGNGLGKGFGFSLLTGFSASDLYLLGEDTLI